ncbi:MAG: histidine kinase [Nannocystaceae bacterium]|nr:histidine kinase [Nannocystaceae bacterium]
MTSVLDDSANSGQRSLPAESLSASVVSASIVSAPIVSAPIVSPPSLLRSTLRALLVPRRLIPIVVMSVPLVAAQAHLSSDSWAGPLGAVMCVVFFLLAPASWRALFPPDAPRPTFAAPFGRVIVYAVSGAGTVVIVGSVIPDLLGMQPTLMTSDISLWVSVALFWVGGYGLGHTIDMERSLERERARSETLQQEAERAQLLALRAHLDPHFLFNTLNAIAEWCREDGEAAERATLALSDMLRTVLKGTQVPAWPLLRELELCHTLLRLHRVRDPERLKIELAWDDPLPPLEVPPMVLLPLVENAMKHGPGAGNSGTVTLRANTLDDVFVFEVENPGEFTGLRVGGEGLSLVSRRLIHAYGGRAELSIDGHEGRTVTRVTIPLTCKTPETNA